MIKVYEIGAKSRNSWLNYRKFCKFLHTFCRAVTLTFDLLTSKFYSIFCLMYLNYVQNLSEIE